MTGRHPLTVEEDRTTRSLAQREFSVPMVVEAGAGTGKTALLVARVVAWCMGHGWALHEDKDRAPEEIARRVIEGVVAITFTEAAAAEMARKIGEAFAALTHGLEPVGWKPEGEAWDISHATTGEITAIATEDFEQVKQHASGQKRGFVLVEPSEGWENTGASASSGPREPSTSSLLVAAGVTVGVAVFVYWLWDYR